MSTRSPIIDRKPLPDVEDVLAEEACQRTRPHRIGDAGAAWVEGATARLVLATVLPRMLVVFAEDGFGGRGEARRQLGWFLRGCAVFDDIEAAGRETERRSTGDFLTMAEIGMLLPIPPLWARHALGDHCVARTRRPLLGDEVGPVGDAELSNWCAAAQRAPDAAAAQRLSLAEITHMRHRVSSWQAPFTQPVQLARDLVRSCAVMAAWKGDAWCRKPDGVVEIRSKPIVTSRHGGYIGEHITKMEPTHPAEALSMALKFVGIAITADDLQAQIAERYFALREAWRKGEHVPLPNGRYIPPNLVAASLPLPSPLPLFDEARS